MREKRLMESVRNAVRIDRDDNVATVLVTIDPGATVVWDTPPGVVAREPIPSGHKVALTTIAPGQPILKYGQPIGVASQPIAAGQHVHTHNLTGQEV
jgi:hypothetical protein